MSYLPVLSHNILGEELISIRQRKPYDSFAVRYVSFILGYSGYGTYAAKWVVILYWVGYRPKWVGYRSKWVGFHRKCG